MKLTGIGIITAIIGGLLFVFKIIGIATEKEFTAADKTIEQVLKPETLDYIDAMKSPFIQDMVLAVIGAPLYLHLVIVGIILAIIGGFMAK